MAIFVGEEVNIIFYKFMFANKFHWLLFIMQCYEGFMTNSHVALENRRMPLIISDQEFMSQ